MNKFEKKIFQNSQTKLHVDLYKNVALLFDTKIISIHKCTNNIITGGLEQLANVMLVFRAGMRQTV